MRRVLKGAAVGVGLAFALSIIGPSGIDWCSLDWVNNSEFWRWYFNCGDAAGGGSSGANYW
jgi:hypothetical protein